MCRNYDATMLEFARCPLPAWAAAVPAVRLHFQK